MADQRTIRRKVTFEGRGLQTGKKTRVSCSPAKPDAGITIARTDLESAGVWRLGEVAPLKGLNRRSAIGSEEREVQTVEHFLAALWALGVDNLDVEVHGGEIPGLDGSASGFIEEMKKGEIVGQSSPRKVIKIKEKEEVRNGDSFITVLPDEVFSVSYSIDYDVRSIKKEEFQIDLDEGSFEKEIAPARTFCMKTEAALLIKRGLGKGATLENTLVLDDDGAVGTKMRFENEPVRHKVLDLVGDFYILGSPVIGKVIAKKSGHALNAEMMRKIYDKYVKKD